jgi:hypothetical protein
MNTPLYHTFNVKQKLVRKEEAALVHPKNEHASMARPLAKLSVFE